MADQGHLDSWQRRILQWAVLLLFCATLAVIQVWENQRRRAARQAYQATYERMYQLNRAAEDRVRAIRSGWPRTSGTGDPTRHDVEELLGQPGLQYGSDATVTAFYTDPATGGQVRLHFAGDRWLGESASTPAIALPRASEAIGVIRRLACFCGYLIWAVMFLASFAVSREVPKRLAEPLLILAVACTFLSFLGPLYWRAWNRFFQDDSPGWGLIMIPLSLALLIWTRRRRELCPDPLCCHCGYNLTGNISGVCPECGTPIHEPARRPGSQASVVK